ncbi:MAG: hypothetical protein IPL73_24535 [Candidatus Obscuribacter sp.]|nr:hypothetical protein [Candidatus Obscuribacter sp.]
MKKLLAILAIAGTFWCPALAAEEVSGNLPETKPVGIKLNQEVPLGGIIMWWGARGYVNENDMPNWQICNGDPVRKGSPLLTIGILTVPNLEGKFARGAASNIAACPTVPDGAGQSTLKGLKTDEITLLQHQIPGHSHGVDEVVKQHTHDTQTDYIWGPGGGGGIRLIMERCGQNGKFPLHAGKGGVGPMPMGDVPYSIVGKANLGDAKELPGGGNGGHYHPLPNLDIRPEYVNVYYLIRVK